jgi:uridylate kinase
VGRHGPVEGVGFVRRVLLKLSGEALAGEAGFGVDPAVVARLCADIATARKRRCGDRPGAGWRQPVPWRRLQAAGLGRVTGDQMGMLATVMNGLAFRDLLRQAGVSAALYSAIELPGVAERFHRDNAVAALARGEVAVLVAGTGNPFFTTDTAACLRGIEIDADVVLKATKVDGVYTADPLRDATARRFDELSYDEVLARDLQVMDLTAICLCRDHGMPLVVFDMQAEGALIRLVNGEKVGTRIGPGARVRGARLRSDAHDRRNPGRCGSAHGQVGGEPADRICAHPHRARQSVPARRHRSPYYGTDTPLNQVASVSVEDARTLVISPWEKKLIPDIEKAILKSDLGLTPNSTSELIRLPLPALTEENRRDLAKQARHEAENAKVAIRNIRRDAIGHVRDLVKDKEVAEDEAHRSEETIQKLTDKRIGEVDKALEAKEADLMAFDATLTKCPPCRDVLHDLCGPLIRYVRVRPGSRLFVYRYDG